MPRHAIGRLCAAAVLAVAGAVLVPVTPAHAVNTTYYVNPNSSAASDSGPGTQAQPWATISKVNSFTFGSGDTIAFARGTSYSTTLVVDNSGTSASPITVTAYGSGTAPTFSKPGGTAIEVTGDYVVVRDVKITNAANSPTLALQDRGGIIVRSGADHVTIRNNEVTNSGVGIRTNGQYGVIRDNNIHDLVLVYDNLDRGAGIESYGAICVSVNNSHNEIAYNDFTRCRAPSDAYGWDGGAIEIEGRDWPKNDIWIHHNVAVDNTGFIEVAETSSSDVTVEYNLSNDYQQFIAWDTTTTPDNYVVRNNTVLRNKTTNLSIIFDVYHYRETGPAPTDAWMTFSNNIFYTTSRTVLRTSGTKAHEFPHHHNLFFGMTDPLGYPLGEGDLIADPRFTNLATGDLRPTLTSPSVDNGTTAAAGSDLAGNPRNVGLGTDMGAYEYQAYSAGGTNLVADGGFETQTSITAGTTPWYVEGSFNVGVDVNAGKAHSGQDNGWLATSTLTSWGALKQNVPVTADSTYRLVAWVRNSGTFNRAFVGAKTSGGTVLNEVRHGRAPGYTRIVVTFQTGSATTAVLHSGYWGPGTASWQQVDTVSLVKL